METNLDIDPALVAEFIDESIDVLGDIGNFFVSLEANPSQLSIVESIFRPIHSIKGNSSFFGFVRIKTLSHEMETLLDLVRKSSLQVSKPLIDVLLEGVDELRRILERCRVSEPEIVDETAFLDLVARVMAQALGEDDISAAVVAIVERLEKLKPHLQSNGFEAEAELDSIISEISSLSPKEEKESGEDARHPWPQPLRNIKRLLKDLLEDMLPEESIVDVRAELEALRECAKAEKVEAGLTELLDTFDTFVNSVGFDALLQDIMLRKLDDLNGPDSWKAVEAPEEPQAAEVEESAPEPRTPDAPGKSAAEPQKTMRVPEAHIDTFLSYVGELLVVGDMFTHLQKNVAESSKDWDFVSSFKLANNTFNGLSDNLQESIMSIRKVSIGTLLQKVPRLIRDIASKTGKRIAVKISGDDIQIDKSLMDLLDAPITHMVRNAGDHGIELPDARVEQGKPAEGTVEISAVDDGTNLVLTVTDDGAGIDYEAIQAKAESIGLVKKGQTLSSEELVNFLFASGVSTAAEVTDISGRGVGMDVVKRTIEEAGGNITVSSESGKGSVFVLKLPKTVTTQIMHGFLVESAGQVFVLPMNKVQEASQVEGSLITNVVGRGKCVTRNGRILPLISLSSALGSTAAKRNGNNERIMVTLNSVDGTFAMCVDKVVGVQKVVFREINGLDCRSETVSGAALMGDGSVALILDVNKLYSEYFQPEKTRSG